MLKNHEALDEIEITEVNGGKGYSGPCFVYQLKKGDCLSVIAQKYGTTVATLTSLNNIPDANIVREGHKLLIPYKG